MTKRKARQPTLSDTNRENLRLIAKYLDAGKPLPPEVAAWLADALRQIAAGEDANKALEVKRSRGRPQAPPNPHKELKLKAAMSWIVAAMQPFPEGFGYSFDDAVAKIAGPVNKGGCGYSEETLKNYWSHNPELRTLSFQPPAELLPKRPLEP